jgi:hypothetical protein
MINQGQSAPIRGGSARDHHLHGEQQKREHEDQHPVRHDEEAIEADADTAEGQQLKNLQPPVLRSEVDVFFRVARRAGHGRL